MSNNKQNGPGDKPGGERNIDNMLDQLKSFYTPDKNMQDVGDFLADIESKIESRDPQSVIKSSLVNMESSYSHRQDQLEQFEQELKMHSDFANNIFEQNKIKASDLKFKYKKARSRWLYLFLIVFFFGLIVTLQNSFNGKLNFKKIKTYSDVVLPDSGPSWRHLNLSGSQSKQLQKLDEEWKLKINHQTQIMSRMKFELGQELDAKQPDFARIESLERNIIDLEYEIKQKHLDYILQKRFVLNEKQTLKLIRNQL